MGTEQEIELLKSDLLSTDWKKMNASAEKLSKISGADAFDFFIRLLDLDNQHNLSRNVAALSLREIGDDRAIDPLLNAILKKENICYNGTLVYALEKLNCAYIFNELFEILFYHAYEAKLSAYNILSEQQFLFNNNDLLKIKSTWDAIQIDTGSCLAYEDSKEMIEDSINQYLPYLTSN